MRTHSRTTWPLFVAVALVALLGLFVLHGATSGIVLFADLLAFLGVGVYALAGEDVNDGCGGIAGGTSF